MGKGVPRHWGWARRRRSGGGGGGGDDDESDDNYHPGGILKDRRWRGGKEIDPLARDEVRPYQPAQLVGEEEQDEEGFNEYVPEPKEREERVGKDGSVSSVTSRGRASRRREYDWMSQGEEEFPEYISEPTEKWKGKDGTATNRVRRSKRKEYTWINAGDEAEKKERRCVEAPRKKARVDGREGRKTVRAHGTLLGIKMARREGE